MPTAPLRRLALLGGGFSTEDDRLLDNWMLGHVRKPRPRVCFVPTASGDAPAYIEQFLDAFASRTDCESTVLPLFRRELDDGSLRSFLLAQDVVYVGGGNTANLLAVWRAHGVDRLMRQAYERGTLVCGIDQGAVGSCREFAEAPSEGGRGPRDSPHAVKRPARRISG